MWCLCHFHILLCPWTWTWSTVTFSHGKVATDLLGFTPVSLVHLLLLFLMCSRPPAHGGKTQWGNQAFSEGRWAQIWLMASGFTALHARASMNLRVGTKLDWSGRERGEGRPTKAGSCCASSLVLMLWGPLSTKEAFLLVSIFRYFSLNRGSRIGNSWWWRFKIRTLKLVRRRFEFSLSSSQA